MTRLEQVTQAWQARLEATCSDQSLEVRSSILKWLLGANPERINAINDHDLYLLQQHLNYRYTILRDRYLNLAPPLAYQRLMRRLISATLIHQTFRTWVEQNRDRQRSLMEMLEEVVQEMLEHDTYLQNQCIWTQHCTNSDPLRHLFLFASLEEYALRPIRNQPLISLRMLTHLVRLYRGGITQVPYKEFIYLISDRNLQWTEELEYPSYFDAPAMEQYEDSLLVEDQHYSRHNVQREFEVYLNQELGEIAVTWLRLYLQGYSQEKASELLGVPLKQLYRLREKITYHAIKVFSVRVQPDLVAEWLNISLQEHNLGLTPSQWDRFWSTLTPRQHLILKGLKKGLSLETIAVQYHLKRNQVNAEWGRLYLAAQRLRNQEEIEPLHS
jgi:DNA-binding CsgD family transcriptional regulator/DNA-directed RNA polymerase specialized sigma24 family protein